MHNINTFRGRTAAWHTLGTVTGKYETTDQLLDDPGFQYVVFKSQLRDGLGRPVDAALPAGEQNQPLEQYQVDYELGEYTDTDYTVIRVEVA